jgi:hypothetical protein
MGQQTRTFGKNGSSENSWSTLVSKQDPVVLQSVHTKKEKLSEVKLSQKQESSESKTAQRFSDDVLALAELLLTKILRNHPKFNWLPHNLQSWADDIDKAIRLDGRTVEELRKVINFAQDSDFWCRNILSGAKLRKQFDKLWLEMIKPHSGSQAENRNRQLQQEEQLRIAKAMEMIRGKITIREMPTVPYGDMLEARADSGEARALKITEEFRDS